MFDLLNGLPIHPLVVHAVVVLLPLAVLGTLAIAFAPRLREKYGWMVFAVTFVATILVPIAEKSGESLETHVGDPGRHAQLGEQLKYVVIPFLILVTAVYWLDRRNRRADITGPTTAMHVVSSLAVIAALVVGVQVYRVGDSGARAAWGGVATQTVTTPK